MEVGMGLELSYLKKLLAFSNVAVTVADAQNKLIVFSKGAEKLTEYKAKDVLGWDLKKFYEIKSDKFTKLQNILLKDGKVEDFEICIINKGGKKIPVSMTVFPLLNKNKKFVGSVGFAVDISEKILMESKIKESEENFRELAEKSPNMIFINRSGKLVYVNKKCVELMGYSKKEFYNPNFDFLSLIAPESLDEIKEAFARHSKGKDVSPYEYSILSKSGEKMYVIITTKLIKHSGEQAVLGIITDITSKTVAEVKLKRTKEMYHSLIENINAAIYKTDKNGAVEFINKKAMDFFGVDEDDLLGDGWLNFLHPDEKEKTIKSLFGFLKTSDKVLELQTKNITKDGNIIFLDHTIKKLFDSKGEFIGTEGFSINVTSKIKSKKLESKISRIDSQRIPLTKKEKLGFYGLVKYPSLNDNQIAKKIGLSRPTLTSIKNRLKNEGYYSTMNVPRVDLLGSKMLSIFYVKFKPDSENSPQLDFLKDYPEIFFKIVSKNQMVLIYLTNDYGVFQKINAEILSKIDKLGIGISFKSLTHFPFNISEFISLFNYSSLLNKRFELNLFESLKTLPSPKKRKLTNKEKLVLYSLVKSPELNVSELSNEINVARTTISQMKKRFFKEGLLVPVNLPDFYKINSELIVLCLMKLHKPIPEFKFNNLSNQVFSIKGHEEVCLINVFENYTEFSEIKNKNLIWLRENKVIDKDPIHFIFSLKEVYLKEFNFAPFLKNLLKI